MVCFTLVVSVSWQLISFCDHFKQHLLQLSKANPVVSLWFEHLPDYALDIPISYFLYFLIKHLKVDGVCVEIVKMLHVSEMDHMQKSDSKCEHSTFIGQCTH